MTWAWVLRRSTCREMARTLAKRPPSRNMQPQQVPQQAGNPPLAHHPMPGGGDLPSRHARESGHPGRAREPRALDSRFRGNDGLRGKSAKCDCPPAPGASARHPVPGGGDPEDEDEGARDARDPPQRRFVHPVAHHPDAEAEAEPPAGGVLIFYYIFQYDRKTA